MLGGNERTNQVSIEKETAENRDYSGCGLSQWETTLQCNIVSHWLRPYPEWSQERLLMATKKSMPIGFLLCYAACCSEHQRAITHGVGRLLYLVKKNQPKHDLTQWNMNKIAVILQTTFSNVFSCKKNIALWFKFQWSLFLRVKLEWSQHWFRQWLGLIRGQAITWNYDDPLRFSIFSKWQVTLEGFLSITETVHDTIFLTD